MKKIFKKIYKPFNLKPSKNKSDGQGFGNLKTKIQTIRKWKLEKITKSRKKNVLGVKMKRFHYILKYEQCQY